ncbi:MAG: hypothetical protein ABJB47_04170 [Actinomycetota bacterium]
MLDGMSQWLPALKRKAASQRCWLQSPDGMYYRNYALIQSELEQAMANGQGRLADVLIAEGLRVLEEGPLKKARLGRGDVLVSAPKATNWQLPQQRKVTRGVFGEAP